MTRWAFFLLCCLWVGGAAQEATETPPQDLGLGLGMTLEYLTESGGLVQSQTVRIDARSATTLHFTLRSMGSGATPTGMSGGPRAPGGGSRPTERAMAGISPSGQVVGLTMSPEFSWMIGASWYVWPPEQVAVLRAGETLPVGKPWRAKKAGQTIISLPVDGTQRALPALQVNYARGGRTLVLDDPEWPLMLEADGVDFRGKPMHMKLQSVTTRPPQHR